MGLELVLERWSGRVAAVPLGATKKEGGTRCEVISVGGDAALPCLFREGELPHPPVVAYEIWDVAPADWSESVASHFKDTWKDPLDWAEKCVKTFGARLLCVRLQGTHPDVKNSNPDEAARFISGLLRRVQVPLIIVGCGDDAKDNAVLPACSEAAKGERCLIGEAAQDNYKTIAAAVLADGHAVIAQSPIDINIAKQLNILISDMGLPLERIVMNPTIGALGYGLEYAYSIMERSRLAAFSGDKTLANPFICFVGYESWRAKEARASQQEYPAWGDESERGIMWECVTASALIQSGAGIIVMRHPTAIDTVNGYIKKLWQGQEEG